MTHFTFLQKITRNSKSGRPDIFIATYRCHCAKKPLSITMDPCPIHRNCHTTVYFLPLCRSKQLIKTPWRRRKKTVHSRRYILIPVFENSSVKLPANVELSPSSVVKSRPGRRFADTHVRRSVLDVQKLGAVCYSLDGLKLELLATPHGIYLDIHAEYRAHTQTSQF